MELAARFWDLEEVDWISEMGLGCNFQQCGHSWKPGWKSALKRGEILRDTFLSNTLAHNPATAYLIPSNATGSNVCLMSPGSEMQVLQISSGHGFVHLVKTVAYHIVLDQCSSYVR